VVSARTGRGLPGLLAAVEAALPGRDTEVSALVPYGRGDLVARAHQEGEVLTVAHCEDGTQLTARVPPELAAQLAGASVDRANAGSVAQTHHLAGSRQNGETA
jgi:GTP-binding protein HflX